MGRHRRVLAISKELVPIIFFLTIWQILSLLLGSDRLPSTLGVLEVFARAAWRDPIIEAQGGGALGYSPHVLATSIAYLRGFVGGAFAGLLIALALGQNRMLLHLVEPLTEFIRVLPPLLIIPFSLLFTKDSSMAELATVGISAALGMMIYVLSALRSVPRSYIELGRLLGAGLIARIWHIQLPAIAPELVGALRVTSVLSLGVAVVTEYLAVPTGIGRVIKYAISFSNLDLIGAGILWSIVIALLVDVIILLASRFLLKWTTRGEQSSLSLVK